MIGTVLAGYILYCIVVPFRTSYNRDLDIIKSWYLIIVAAVFAVLFHSNLNRSVWADFGWAFSQYLETIAILSQFILFNKKVIVIANSGRINRDLHVSFHSSTSDFKDFVANILGFYLHRAELVQQEQGIQPPARVRGVLVHARADNPSPHHGGLPLLLDKSSPPRRRGPAPHIYMI